jgi:hypothetical protein
VWFKGWLGPFGLSKAALVMVKKFSFLIPELNSFTCLRIYLRNVSLNQRLRSMMVNTGTQARYMAIAAPHCAECRPS